MNAEEAKKQSIAAHHALIAKWGAIGADFVRQMMDGEVRAAACTGRRQCTARYEAETGESCLGGNYSPELGGFRSGADQAAAANGYRVRVELYLDMWSCVYVVTLYW